MATATTAIVEGKDAKELVIIVAAGRTIGGCIVDKMGKAVRGASVGVIGPYGKTGVPRAITDDSGRFVVDGLEEARVFRLSIRRTDGKSALVKVRDAALLSEEVVITLQE